MGEKWINILGLDQLKLQPHSCPSLLSFHHCLRQLTAPLNSRTNLQVFASLQLLHSFITNMSSVYHDSTTSQFTCQQGDVAWNNVSEGLSMDADKQPSLLEGDIEKIETPVQGNLSLCEVDKNQEPCEGMLFDSEEAARTFYDAYASRVGFVTRVLSSRKSERDGTIISRGLGCRGDLEHHKNESIMVQKKNKGREGCAAMILVKREKPGNWVVRKFVREHNHPLRVSTSKRRPTFDEKDKRIQELTTELRVKKRLSAAYREQLLALMKDVDGHNEHLFNKVQVVRSNLKNLEARNGHI